MISGKRSDNPFFLKLLFLLPHCMEEQQFISCFNLFGSCFGFTYRDSVCRRLILGNYEKVFF
ncbi:MAG: hypothetical protein BM485_10305 [Desulfobulbaceae bacterium DB1]|nr:MAG: hypothetical protein BM485_10305 [Desulfobulbaceae bacterium DB1]